ncbi:MAG: hypothetical protein C0616_11245 [Desulfuromonas sp.]|nr:MAG: hypothetical protein C0616_11245 [Desulfuromonas sp.]
MRVVLNLSDLSSEHQPYVGGKAATLASLRQKSHNIPPTQVVPSYVYQEFLETTQLAGQIQVEMGRKDFSEMRWEEMWDASLRIRNLFQRTPLPEAIRSGLREQLNPDFLEKALVVRSSSSEEDSARQSFAGLHDSVVNVQGIKRLETAIITVWASLWSDRALLYRKELNLDPHRSSMAVVIQTLIIGERSGVLFTQNPNDKTTASLEAVYGLNAGLVDGSIEPDGWEISRANGAILKQRSVHRSSFMAADKHGTKKEKLPSSLENKPPLSASEIAAIFNLGKEIEICFGSPQDIEWTIQNSIIWLLQARPITTLNQDISDPRTGYLNLHRSFEELKTLRLKIETDLIPCMEHLATTMAQVNLQELSDTRFVNELNNRRESLDEWEEKYRTYCIPMAHGIRLFGTFYNDLCRPEEPFEFVQLLSGTGMKALQRNQALLELASQGLKNEDLEEIISGDDRFNDVTGNYKKSIVDLLSHFPKQPGAHKVSIQKNEQDRKHLEKHYLAKFSTDERDKGVEILELARASYRLRDDDNISLGKIRHQLDLAEKELQRRLKKATGQNLAVLAHAEAKETGFHASTRLGRDHSPHLLRSKHGQISVRQYQGQPAAAGIATGKARIIQQDSDLKTVETGEILVCDAIDPVMTFVVPLAGGIIERRGGMLIHGAIIAREYRIPCVTGIAEATNIIKTGDKVTVDGYLGLITIHRE